MHKRFFPLALASAFTLCGSAAAEMLLIRAAQIHTLDPKQPQVQALLIEDGRIRAVGAYDTLTQAHPQVRTVDLGAATVLPGLIDAHGHVLGLGLALSRVDLVGTRDKAEVVERLRAHEKSLPDPTSWLLGRGWDQNDWPEPAQGFPSAADLDAAFPDRPVVLERVDGHATWINTAAMARISLSLDGDWQPDGGWIQRDDVGQATGILIDAAAGLIESKVPPVTAAERKRAYRLAFDRLLSAGLTGVHDAGTSVEDLAVLEELADAGELPLRLTTMADGDGAALARLCKKGLYAHPSGRLQMRTVKLYADGALGSRGAALLADYSDAHGNQGLLVMSEPALRKAIGKAEKCGVQVATHAIGDRANRIVLDLYEALAGPDAKGQRRWRIEHAQVLAPEDLARLASLGVVASMQPTHATSDMPWAGARLGPQRILGAYAWRDLREAGTRLALGSDFPVESHRPLLGLAAAVSRQDLSGQPAGGWYPNQRLTTFEAVRGFTADAAWAGFAETEVGQLKAGMRADFVVLARDPFALAQGPGLAGIAVEQTWVDGAPVYRSR